MIPLTRKLRFQGDSMLPLLEDGDEVLMRSASWGETAPGDLVVWARFSQKGASLVVHRLVSLSSTAEGNGFSAATQGDANPYPDEPPASGDLLGKVVGFRRRWVSFTLGAGAGRFWDRSCRLYARLIVRPWSRGGSPSPLRALILTPPRLLFLLLSRLPSRPS